MPLFMDVHRDLGGVTPEALREAHLQDVEVRRRFNVEHAGYVFNPATGPAARAPSTPRSGGPS